MKRIRTKLMCAFFVITMLTVSGIGGYSIYSITSTVRSMSIEKQERKISFISQNIENYLDDVLIDLNFLKETAVLKTLKKSLQSGNKNKTYNAMSNLATDFLSFSRQKKIYQKIRFINKKGKELVRVDRYNDKSIIVDKTLQNISGEYYFEDTIILNNRGIMISALDLTRENGTIIKPFRPTIRYATPVYDGKKQVLGILVLNVRANNFLTPLRNFLVKKDLLFLVDNDGYFIFHPDRSKEWGGRADLNSGENLRNDFTKGIFDKISKNKDLFTIEQDKHIITSMPVYLNAEKTLTLGHIIDVIPMEVVFSTANKLRDMLILITGIVLVMSFFVSGVLARTITNPLRYLALGADEMSKGNMDKEIKVTSRDEIKTLADSIERLRKSIKILMERSKKKETDKIKVSRT